MRLLLVLFLISANILAGYIIPNVRRRKIDRNNRGAAVSWSKRNNLNIAYGIDKFENEKLGLEVESKNTLFSGFFHHDLLSAEIELTKNSMERLDSSIMTESDLKEIDTSLGFRFNKRLALGLDLIIQDEDIDRNIFGLSTSYRMPKNIYLGAGLRRESINSVDIDNYEFHAGLGMISKRYTLEGVLLVGLGDENNGAFLRDNFSLIGEWTYRASRRLEIYSFIVLQSESAEYSISNINEEEKSVRLIGEAEYLITKKFALGGLVEFSKVDFEDKGANPSRNEASNKLIGLTSRFKFYDVQLAAMVRLGSRDNDDNGIATESDISEWELELSYFF